jgi:hypothetical protein
MKLLFNHIFLSIFFVFSITFLLPVSTKAQPVPRYRSFNMVDIEGNPIADAMVEIFAKGKLGGSPKETLQTDEQGDIPNFLINGLIDSYYSYGNIKISKPGYIPTILLLSDTNKKHISNESNPMLFEDMAIFESRRDCPNCCNLLGHTENLSYSTNRTKPKSIKIKLLLLPTTKTEWEMLAQEQKNRELISAIVKDDILTVRTILQLGADANAKSRHDIPAIVWATVHGNRSMLEALLEAGADVKSKNSLAQKTLLYYIEFAHMNNLSSKIDIEIVRKLIKAGADVNASNRYGTKALDFTSSKFFKNKAVTKLLKQNGATYSVSKSRKSKPL